MGVEPIRQVAEDLLPFRFAQQLVEQAVVTAERLVCRARTFRQLLRTLGGDHAVGRTLQDHQRRAECRSLAKHRLSGTEDFGPGSDRKPAMKHEWIPAEAVDHGLVARQIAATEPHQPKPGEPSGREPRKAAQDGKHVRRYGNQRCAENQAGDVPLPIDCPQRGNGSTHRVAEYEHRHAGRFKANDLVELVEIVNVPLESVDVRPGPFAPPMAAQIERMNRASAVCEALRVPYMTATVLVEAMNEKDDRPSARFWYPRLAEQRPSVAGAKSTFLPLHEGPAFMGRRGTVLFGR